METYFRICKKILAPLLATLFISGCSLVVYLPTSSSQLNILKTSSVSSNLFSVVADGASNSIITVTLFDKNGVPLVGKILSLSSSRGATDTIGAASGSSNASGVVTFNVTSTTTGVAIFSAIDVTDSTHVVSTTSVIFTPGAVTQIVMATVTIANTTSMTPLTSITIYEEDSFNNLVTTASDSIAINLSTDPSSGGAHLTGTTNLKAVNGVAVFNALRIDLVNNGYVVTGQFGLLIAAPSNPFNITQGAPSQLIFTEPPLGGRPTIAISPTITVAVADGGGNIVTSNTDAISVALNPSPGFLGGTTTVAAVAGVASFSTLTVSTSGAYQLTATDGALSLNVTSPFFSIVGTAPVNIQVPIEMLDSTYSSQNTLTPGNSRMFFDPAYYDGTLAYSFEIVATNTSGGAITVNLQDTQAAPVNYASIIVPNGTLNPTRFTQAFGSGAFPGLMTYRLRTSANSASFLTYTARFIVTQTGATRTRIWVPLLTNLITSAGTILSVDATTSSILSQPTASNYLNWIYDLTHFVATSIGFTLETGLRLGTCADLVDLQTGLTVSESGVTIENCSSSNFNQSVQSNSFDSAAINFTPGHSYGIEIKSPSQTNALISRGGLWIALNGITSAQSIYRTMRYLNTAASGVTAQQRESISLANFTSGSVYFQCLGSGGASTINLFDAVVSDVSVAGANVSPVINLPASEAWTSTVPFAITNGDRFITNYTVGGSMTINACETLVNLN